MNRRTLFLIFLCVGTGRAFCQSPEELALFRKKLGLANFVIDRQARPFLSAEDPNGYVRQNETKTGYFLAGTDGQGAQVMLDPQSGQVDHVEWFEKAPLSEGIRKLLLNEKKYIADGSDKTCQYFTNGIVGLSFCTHKNGLRVWAYLSGPSSIQGEFTWDEPLENTAPVSYSEARENAPVASYDAGNLQNDLKRTDELAAQLRVRERADSALQLLLKTYGDTSQTYQGKPLQVSHYKSYVAQLEPGEYTRRHWTVTYYFDSRLYQGLAPLPGHFPGNYDHIQGVPEKIELVLDTQTGQTEPKKTAK